MYYYLVNKDVLLGSSLKVMSTSIHHALGSYPKCQCRWVFENKKDYKIVVIIRNPVDRLKSAYKFIDRLNNINYDYFVDLVLDGANFDNHLVSQREDHSYNNIFLPNEIVRIENVKSWWSDNIKVDMPVLNKTEDLLLPDYRDNDIVNYYQEDMLLWLEQTL